MGGDAHHAEDAALRAPADHLDGEGVLLHQVGRSTFARLRLLKDFGGLQLVEHLQCDWEHRRGEASTDQGPKFFRSHDYRPFTATKMSHCLYILEISPL